MNDITKTITPSIELVTNLSNDNVSLPTKTGSLEEEIKSFKNENSDLIGDIKTQLKVIQNLSDPDSVTSRDKMIINYISDNNRSKTHLKIATSRN